jgi:hypothetical protein
VRLAVGGLAAMLALAEDEGVGEGGPAGGDVDGSAAGEVERREVVEPAVGVPGPVSDGLRGVSWGCGEGGKGVAQILEF